MRAGLGQAFRNPTVLKSSGISGGWLLLVVTALLGGCGGDNDAAQSGAGVSRADMMPAGYDSATADSVPGSTPTVDSHAAVAEVPENASNEEPQSRVRENTTDLYRDSASRVASSASTGAPESESGHSVATDSGRPSAHRAAETVTTTSGQALGSYWLQTGSFRDEDNARHRLEELATVGCSAVLTVATVEGVTYHRVCVPNLRDMDAAHDLGERLRRELGLTYLVCKD